MRTDLREYSRAASNGIKTAAGAMRQTVLKQFLLLKESVPNGFQELSAADRHDLVEDLRAGLIAWTNEIDPVVAELRSLLRQLQDELWDTNWQPDPDTPLIDEEDMPWTQAARDRKEFKQ